MVIDIGIPKSLPPIHNREKKRRGKKVGFIFSQSHQKALFFSNGHKIVFSRSSMHNHFGLFIVVYIKELFLFIFYFFLHEDYLAPVKKLTIPPPHCSSISSIRVASHWKETH